MIYPEFIKQGHTIGVTAPSEGNVLEEDLNCLSYAKSNFEKMGYSVSMTANVMTNEKGRSSSKEERASQLMELIEDDRVKQIIFAKGGDYLMEILPLIDYEKIREHPTWIQGYSDSTGLVMTTMLNADVATVYGTHFNDYAMQPFHGAIQNNLDVMQGIQKIQKSFDRYESSFQDKMNPTDGYELDTKVEWKTSTGCAVEFSGRMIGGCMDVVLDLVGTPYADIEKFQSRYGKDGIVWFLEDFALDSGGVSRGLWRMREAGWFRHTKGFVFGRPTFFKELYEIDFQEAVMSEIGGLDVPVIFDADIGHRKPQFTVVSGAMGQWQCDGGRGQLHMEYHS